MREGFCQPEKESTLPGVLVYAQLPVADCSTQLEINFHHHKAKSPIHSNHKRTQTEE